MKQQRLIDIVDGVIWALAILACLWFYSNFEIVDDKPPKSYGAYKSDGNK